MIFTWTDGLNSGLLDDIVVYDKLDLPYTWIRIGTGDGNWWAKDTFTTDAITEIPDEELPKLTNAIMAKYEIKTAKYSAKPETPEEPIGILVNDKYVLPMNTRFNNTAWSTLLYDFLDNGGAVAPAYTDEELRAINISDNNAKVRAKFEAVINELDMHPMEAMMLMLKYMAVKMYPSAEDGSTGNGPILGEITPGGKDIVEWGDVMVDKLYNAVKERNENLM